MPEDYSIHYRSFLIAVNHLEGTRKKVELLSQKGHLTRRDVERVYEGLIMKTVVVLESTLEALFLSLLTKTVTHPPRIVPRISSNSTHAMRQAILGGKTFVDWLPFDHTKKRAKAFLVGGRPFTDLTAAERKSLDKLSAIRNAIAHPSRAAHKRFKEDVLVGLVLLNREKTPAGYLRSVYRQSPPQTRFELIAIECADILKRLCR